MTPTVGRIVHYKTRPSEKYPTSTIIAAIITRVNEDGSVCLTKFVPNNFPSPLKKPCFEGQGEGEWHWPERV